MGGRAGASRVVHQLGLGVEHAEDLLQGGHGRLEGVVELRELLDRVEEAGQVADEGHHHADAEVLVEHPRRAEVEDDRRADPREQLDAREVGAREADRGHVGLAVLLVHPPEELAGGLLAAEALHHAHPRERLLEGGEHVGHALAGAPVGAGGVDAEQRRAHRERREDHEGQEGELPVVDEQDRRDPDEGEPVDDQRGRPVGDELVERLDVARQPAHRASGGGPLVVAELQPHEVPEGVGAQVQQHPLAHPAREVALPVAGGPADQSGHHEHQDGEQQDALVVRLDAVVDADLRERRHREDAGGDHHHQEHRQDGPRGIGAEVGQEAPQLPPAPRAAGPAAPGSRVGEAVLTRPSRSGRAGPGRRRGSRGRGRWSRAAPRGCPARRRAPPPAPPARRPGRGSRGDGR